MSDHYVSENDPAAAKVIAEKFGFCLVKRVFSGPEMAELEGDLAAFHARFGRTAPDLTAAPSLRRLLDDPRVQALARSLLGDPIVYYRETAANFESAPGPLTENPFTEYHCDARGTRADLAAQPRELPDKIYPAYRFGIYFRDYRDHSGGLKVAPGSHLRPFAHDRSFAMEKYVLKLPVVDHMVGAASLKFPEAPMELYNVPSQPGDLVVFNLRTFHAAGALRFKDRPTLAVLPVLEAQMRAVAAQLFAPLPAGARNTIFFDFGAPSEEVDFYIKWRASKAPLPLPPGAEYGVPATPGTICRNDRLIVAMAERLEVLTAPGVGHEPSAEARKVAGELADLCAAHLEFSAHHPLFDRAAFAGMAARDGFAAAVGVAREIQARRALRAGMD